MISRVRRTPATDPTDHADRRDPRIPRQSIGTRIASLFAAAALALTAVVVIPAPASAAPNPGIVVSNVVLTTSDGGPATVGDRLTVSGEWDASGANPQPGDTFTIGLPSVLGFPEAVPFTLDGPAPDGSTVSWATCLTDPGTGVATCTLTDEVAAFPELVMGSFEVEIEAILTTTEESVVFDLNGVATPVDLPGEGGIDDGITLPDTWDKSGEMNSDKWSMSWTINLPGSRLAGQETVTIFEQLSDNHQLCDPSQLRVQTVRGSTVIDVTSIASVSTDVAAPYDFSIVLAPESGFNPDVTYRITYDTCTPDGMIDPVGTVYENEAVVDVWGESSGVIGVEQDWSFSDVVSKQGSVLGGGERNGTIRWTVTVAGDHLVGKDGFTLAESLSGEHEVCASTISGIRVFEQYGPSSTLRQEITGELTATTVSSSADAFEVAFAIASGSDFEFRPSDSLYLIQYDTCATTDGLPEAGTAFGNTASVDGTVDSSEATVPGRTQQKRGSINTSAVTIDGVEYLPQTTLNWSITVPGERLVDVESDLDVTDVLTPAHEVCVGSGGSLAERLGLRVEARDQIQNGGLATVDLTDSVEVDLEGDTLTFVIPQPTLPQPGGGESTGFSREYQYVISYTTCTTSGGMDAPGTTYGNSAELAGISFTHSVTQTHRGSGTGQGVPRGSISIDKDLADTAGAAFVPNDAVFTVHAKEIDPTGTVQVEYDLQVPLNGDPVSGPNSRGEGWTVELSEPSPPSIPGVVFGAPAFTESDGVTVSADGTTAVADLLPGANIDVELTNTPLLGAIDVSKLVEGPAAALVEDDREYSIVATIDTSALGDGFPEQDDRTFTIATGEPYSLTDLPIGAVVTLTETLPADDDVLRWSPATISPNGIEVLAQHATEPALVTVLNTVNRTVGTFSLVKTVTGDQASNPAVPAEVSVTASWIADGVAAEKTLTLPTDGTPVPFGESLLIGTEVTLTERPLEDGSSIAWGAPVWSGSGVTIDGEAAIVTIGRDASATVALENHAATSDAGISLIKGLAGDAAAEVDPSTEFPVTATWMDAGGEEQSLELTINSLEPTPLGVDLPAGTLVTITEGERPAFDTVDWGSIVISGAGVEDAGDGSATVTVSDQQSDVTLVTVVNEANWAPGTISIQKRIEGILLDDTEVPETVTVVARWVDATETTQSKELTLPTDGTVVPFGEDLPHGTEVQLTELDSPESERFTWATASWSGARTEDRGDGTAVVTIGAAIVAEVTLTNEAIPLLGNLVLAKALTGTGASLVPSSTSYPLTLSWVDLLGEDQEENVEVRTGAPTVVEGLPVGTDVRITEAATTLPDQVRWTGVDWASDDPDVVIGTLEDEPVAVVPISGNSAVALKLTNPVALASDLALTGMDASRWGATAALGVLVLGVGALLVVARRRGVA